MSDTFTAYEGVLSSAVNGMFGEKFLLVGYKPAADVNAPPIVDPDRPQMLVTGVWVEQSKGTPLQARGAVQDDNAHRLVDGHPVVHIDDRELVWKPRRFDRITRISTAEIYQASSPPRPDGMGRTTIPLSMRMRTA